MPSYTRSPLFIRAGSNIKLGDLHQEYKESVAIAQKKPDLKALDAEVKAWFEKAQVSMETNNLGAPASRVPAFA